MIILAIGAHPDDLEISCAGTLAKMVQAGHEVVLVHACSGDKGHFEIPPDELTRIRAEEAQQAGAVIASRVISLGVKDMEIRANDEEVRRKFIDLMCEVQPDIVITHTPDDYMNDHTVVSQLVFDTTFAATLPGASERYSSAKQVPALFYMDNLSGMNFQPTIYVDITNQFAIKLDMMRKHDSQLQWLKDHDGVDILDCLTTLGKMRGMQAGCNYAEGFIQHMVWGRPNAVRFPV